MYLFTSLFLHSNIFFLLMFPTASVCDTLLDPWNVSCFFSSDEGLSFEEFLQNIQAEVPLL